MSRVYEVTVKLYVPFNERFENDLDNMDEYMTSIDYAKEIVEGTLYGLNFDAVMTGNLVRTSSVIGGKVVSQDEMTKGMYRTEYDK